MISKTPFAQRPGSGLEAAPLPRPDEERVLASLRKVAARFGEEAQATILHENAGKHVLEIGLILEQGTPGLRVLDVGGGMGVNLLALRDLCGESLSLHLTDRFDEYVEDNRMGAREAGFSLMRGEGIDVLRQDFWGSPHLAYRDGCFDVVTILDVVEHLPGHPVDLLREIRRVLAPGGRIILSGPNSLALTRRVRLLMGEHPYMPFDLWCADRYYSHYREYSRPEYVELLRRAGFSLLKAFGSDEPTRTKARRRFLRGRQAPVYSPRILALHALGIAERAIPGFRSSIYAVAEKPPAPAGSHTQRR